MENIFQRLWGYHQSGTGEDKAFTLYPKLTVPGGGPNGGNGFPDVALAYFETPAVSDVLQVAVEFKGDATDLDAPQTGRSDKRSPVRQCLDILNSARRGMVGNEAVKPTWGIVTDMNEFRLYWYDRAPGQYLVFNIRQDNLLQGPGLLADTDQARFDRYLFKRLFHRDTLLTTGGKSLLEGLIGRAFIRQRELETEFYKEYRAFREHLYRTLLEHNAKFLETNTRGRLVRLAQKILDRAIFVFYCEDMGQALKFPPQLLRDFLIKKSRDQYLKEHGGEIWSQLRDLFSAMNDGTAFGGKKLNQFNGGLFARDDELDQLIIPNSAFCMPGQGHNEASLYANKRTLLYLSAAYNYAADLAKSLMPEPVAKLGEDEAVAAANARNADPETSLGLYTLGRIFEQSITELEILEAEADNRVSVNKESRRKRDGVYYTPEPIVERIVEETLGARLTDFQRECGWRDGREPSLDEIDAYRKRLEEITILDPACGSGAFLITAMQRLLSEWQSLYALRETIVSKAAKTDPFKEKGQDELIRDVLRKNLFGVDINSASVEITQLALWLHTARGDRSLSSLDDHIKCGNSLVDDDFWKGQIELSLYDEEAKDRVNTFDWVVNFPDVFPEGKPGGFDVVIGNPPYVKLQNFRKAHADIAEYLRDGRADAHIKGYASAQTGNFDLYLLFIEKGLSLLKADGRLGYIAPSVWVMNQYGAGLRDLVKEHNALDRWLDFRSFQVFDEATTYTALQFFRKHGKDTKMNAGRVLVADAPQGDLARDPWNRNEAVLPYEKLDFGDRWLMLSGAERNLIDKLDGSCKRLGDRSVTKAVYQGLITSMDKVYHLERLAPGRYLSKANGANNKLEVEIEDAIMHPLVSGPEAKRYIEPKTDTWILFPYHRDASGGVKLIPAKTMADDYPLAWKYLQTHEDALRKREASLNDEGEFELDAAGAIVDAPFHEDSWYRFGRSQALDKQELGKLIVAQTVPSMRVCFDDEGRCYINNVRVNGIAPAENFDPWFILGALNGPVCDFVFKRISKPKDGGYFEANKQFIEPLPIPDVSKVKQKPVSKLSKRLQELHSQRRDALADLNRRIDNSPKRLRPVGFIFPQIVAVADRDADASYPPAARDWAKEEYERELASCYAELEGDLNADTHLRANFERGELKVTADGAPLFAGIFVGDDEGPFIEAQWNAVLDAFYPTGKEPGKKLANALRKLIVTDNEALKDQIIDLQTCINDIDSQIADAEIEMNETLYKLYRLTKAERRLVEAG